MTKVRYLRGQKCLHIEADGCVINIREGLIDIKGRKVTSITVQPDEYAGEKKWKLSGFHNIRVIQLKTVIKEGKL